MAVIETEEQLRAIYGVAKDTTKLKKLTRLDAHARTLIAHSPFVLLGTNDGAGHADVTPRGDAPGFVAVLDDHTLALPDRPGNKLLDSLTNVLKNPSVGLLFLVPGMDETLRINGRAQIVDDADLLEHLSAQGKAPATALKVHVDEVFLHCAKAFIRSALWDPETWPDRSALPTLGQMLKDQLDLAVTADTVDESLAESYDKTLY